MSGEFSCDYCLACPRNPCHSHAEAARCPNQGDPGFYLNSEFKPELVAEWVRYRAQFATEEDREVLEKAATIIYNMW